MILKNDFLRIFRVISTSSKSTITTMSLAQIQTANFDEDVYMCLYNHPYSSAESLARLMPVSNKALRTASKNGTDINTIINAQSSKFRNPQEVEEALNRLHKDNRIILSGTGLPKRYEARPFPLGPVETDTEYDTYSEVSETEEQLEDTHVLFDKTE